MTTERKRNPELRTAWDFVEHTGHSIFLTGKAGTGKTTFLKTVVERSSKRSIVVAPTGVAAINAGGVTIHSFFQLPFSPYIPNTRIKSDYKFSNEKRRIIASLDLLIIDEISMVRADLLDAVDSVLRRFRDWRLPFGGLQLLMIGDLGQLTPVTTPEEDELLKQYYETPYFFSSQALSKINYVTIQLETVYRQQDALFLGILNNIREDKATDRDLAILNQRYIPRFVPDKDGGYIRLTTHNHFANHYNESELGKLPSEAFTYNAFVEGDFPDYSFPTSEVLTLKEGAQVMFIKNDTSEDHLYYNGRIGQVVFANAHKVIVRCTNPEQNIEVTPQEWENTKYTLDDDSHEIKPTVLGKFRQLPLRLAWAITIHKSQGLTFDHAIIDASLSFAPGQVYVALSRCRTLEGMVLASPLTQRSIICDDRVNTYISHQEEEACKSIGQLTTLKESYFQKLLIELFQFRKLQSLEERMLRLLQEYFYNRYTQTSQMHKQQRPTIMHLPLQQHRMK